MKFNIIPKSKFWSACCGLCLAIFVILLLQHTYVESFTQVTGDMQNTSNWITDAKQYTNSMTQKKRHNYKGTPVPLPNGELFFFADNKFQPECCPSDYSSSTGCACMSNEQLDYINMRGGNRSAGNY
mgnify:CR=1 FL=1